MKPIFLLIVVMFLLTSCDWLDSGSKSTDSSTLSGSTSIPINTVGNTFASSIRIGNNAFVANSTATITQVVDGVATIHITSKLPTNIPAVKLISSTKIDASGNLNCDVKFKFTDAGILDYTNKNQEPFVLVRYDANVGDKYTFVKSDGSTIVREVVRKSTTDDFYWGGMIIKTMDVEQSSKIPGISKIVYFTNHKFGLVAIRFNMEDGTISQIDLSPSKY
jgi:hypothetical protein